MKQELGRLSSAPQQIRVLALLARFMKSHGVLAMLNAYWVHESLFVCHLLLLTDFVLPFSYQHFRSTTYIFSDVLTNWTDAHCCYTHEQFCLGVLHMLEERKPPHQF